MFAATGKGVHGAVTEYRHGLQASIRAEIEHNVSRTAWLFQWSDFNGDLAYYHILLSVADRSEALRADKGWDNVTNLEAEETPFDLSAQTLSARQIPNGSIIQVTTGSVSLTTRTHQYAKPKPALMPRNSPTSYMMVDIR